MSTQSQVSTGSARLPRIAHARVRDAMRPEVIACAADTTLVVAARTMAERHVHCVVVPDRDGPGWRVVTALDLVAVRAAADAGRNVGDVAVPATMCVDAEAPLEEAARLMVEQGSDHLLVANEPGGRPCGVLSSLDVAGVIGWGEA